MLTCLRSSGLDKDFGGSPSLGELPLSIHPSLSKLGLGQLSELLGELKTKIKFPRPKRWMPASNRIGDPRNRRKVMDAETQHRISGSNEQAPSAEDWRATIDRLREVVCTFLMKNETMRMTLSTEREKEPISRLHLGRQARLSKSGKSPSHSLSRDR
jgi:hypothetical protein